ncbi:helix-turn-helix domain-containing protein [Bacillus licheniformis]
MQAIAEECKMSKASIYKLFQSKEDLLLALIKFRRHEMLNKSAIINTETSLTPKERFAKKSLWRLRNSGKPPIYQFPLQ